MSVEYSDKLNELYQLLEKYQIKLHLTLSYCWLTPTKNDNANIFQILIENGCPKQKVRFHDKAISSLRFSFNFHEWIKKETNQFYVHCLPDLCTDSAASSIENHSNNNFKSCQNITNLCQGQYFLSRYHKESQTQLHENNRKSLPTLSPDCNYQLTSGPIFITKIGKNSQEKLNYIMPTTAQTIIVSGCPKGDFTYYYNCFLLLIISTMNRFYNYFNFKLHF